MAQKRRREPLPPKRRIKIEPTTDAESGVDDRAQKCSTCHETPCLRGCGQSYDQERKK